MNTKSVVNSITAVLGVILAAILFHPSLAYAAAAADIDDIAKNIVVSTERMPGMISGLSYIFALLLGVTGVLKLKDHVENPTQTPIRVPIIRFAIGGAMLSLPMVYGAMDYLITNGVASTFNASIFSVTGFLSGALGSIASMVSTIIGGTLVYPDINGILAIFFNSITMLPALITALAYLLGLVIGVAGLLKIKDHVENPDQTPLREGITRFVIGGALFAIPTVYDAMANSISGGSMSILSLIGSAFSSLGFLFSGYDIMAGGFCNPLASFGPNPKLGNSICALVLHTGAIPAFLNGISYLIGLVLGVWGVLKLRDHVLNPQQTKLHEGITRLIAGGMFFALPVIVAVMRNTLTPPSAMAFAAAPINIFSGGFSGTGCTPGPGAGLDQALACMMEDLMGPVHIVLNFFTFVTGSILIMVGINRLTKSAQEGARGPGGLGTLVTFVAGGALISYNELIRVFTSTLSLGIFGVPVTAVHATLMPGYGAGLSVTETANFYTVVSAILKFMIMVGLISFVRGIFIIREVAEGNNQASMMSGVTHMVGGALAINLGPVMNMVQATLGITGFGMSFS